MEVDALHEVVEVNIEVLDQGLKNGHCVAVLEVTLRYSGSIDAEVKGHPKVLA